MATWGSGNIYPGTTTPAWWYGTTTTTSTSPQIYVMPQVGQSPPAPRPRTAVEWLRERVQEMCDFAELAT